MTSSEWIRTQWGTRARPFSQYSEAECRNLLRNVQNLMEEIVETTGISVFVSYGVLLGGQRNGELIQNDFDVDVIFHSACADDVLANCKLLSTFLVHIGAELRPKNNGQFTAVIDRRSQKFKVEFFAGWDERGMYFQYFAIPGSIPTTDIFPLSTVQILNVPLLAPRDPISSLKAIYGPGWQTPDPDFTYKFTSDTWKPFKFLFSVDRKQKKFWENYYSSPGTELVGSSNPSDFALFAASQIERHSVVVEFGCGNGRDTLHFLRHGCDVLAIDYCSSALQLVNSAASQLQVSLRTQELNLNNIPEVLKFIARNPQSADHLYARFLTHALNDVGVKNLATIAEEVLRPGGRFYLEFRTRPEGTLEDNFSEQEIFENGIHFRRFRTLEETTKFFTKGKFLVSYTLVAKGLARLGKEDPLIARAVLTRR